MTTEAKISNISELMLEQTRYERARDPRIESEPPITWDRAWEAMQRDRLIQTEDFKEGSTIIIVDSARRGPSASHDINNVLEAVVTTGIRQIRAPRIPHATIAHDLSYFLRGLLPAQQIDILSATGVRQGVMTTTEDLSGTSLANPIEISRQGRFWTQESTQTPVENFQLIMGKWLGIAGVRETIIDKLMADFPQVPNLETGMVVFSNRSMELLIAEHGYQITFDSSPFTQHVPIQRISAAPVEAEILKELLEAQNIEQSAWYQNFRGASRKRADSFVKADQKAADEKWGAIVRNLPQARKHLTFSLALFKEALTNMSPSDAFLSATQQTTDIGVQLYTAMKDGVRHKINGGEETFGYVNGMSTLGQMLDEANHRPNIAIAFQPFERDDPMPMLQTLEKAYMEAQKPIPATVIVSRAGATYNRSILKLLASI